MQAVSISQFDFVSWSMCVPTVDSTSLQYLMSPVRVAYMAHITIQMIIRRSYNTRLRTDSKIKFRYDTVDQVLEYPLKQSTMNFIFDTVYEARTDQDRPVQSSPVQSSLVPLYSYPLERKLIQLTPGEFYLDTIDTKCSELRNTNDQERGNGSNYEHGSHDQERSNHYASNERMELLANYHRWHSIFQCEVERSMNWFKKHIDGLLYDATNDYCITVACPLIWDCPLLSVSSGFLRTTGYTQDQVEEKFHRNFLVQSEMREKTTVCNFRILILMLY